jgi:hypothetical protein
MDMGVSTLIAPRLAVCPPSRKIKGRLRAAPGARRRIFVRKFFVPRHDWRGQGKTPCCTLRGISRLNCAFVIKTTGLAVFLS